MARGTLRIYLGAAPGVGKTCAMLNEGRRLARSGTHMVVGLVETHGRAETAAQVGDLEELTRVLLRPKLAAQIDRRGSAPAVLVEVRLVAQLALPRWSTTLRCDRRSVATPTMITSSRWRRSPHRRAGGRRQGPARRQAADRARAHAARFPGKTPG